MNIYLYIIHCAETNFCKIGITTNIEKRLITLQAGNPLLLTVRLLRPISVEYNIEKYLHKKYSKFRIRGEWFELSYKQLNDIAKKIENYK